MISNPEMTFLKRGGDKIARETFKKLNRLIIVLMT
jgi:hypothetical protein